MTKVYPSFVAPSIAREVFGVTSQTLRRWAKEGKLDFIKTPGGQYRYNVAGHIGARMQPAQKPKAKAPAQAASVAALPVQPATVAASAPQSAPVAALPTIGPKPRPAMPEGVEMRSVDDEPELTMREMDAPRVTVAPRPVHIEPPVHREPPVKLDPAALAQKIEALARASVAQ